MMNAAMKGLAIALGVILMSHTGAHCANEPPGREGAAEVDVYVWPVGDVSRGDLERAANALAKAFGARTAIVEGVPIPKSAYRRGRRQYDASAVLSVLRKQMRQRKLEGKLLGVTSDDLYTKGLNFVLGMADTDGAVAVMSTARLDPAFRRGKPNEKLKGERIAKEAVHELGHMATEPRTIHLILEPGESTFIEVR